MKISLRIIGNSEEKPMNNKKGHGNKEMSLYVNIIAIKYKKHHEVQSACIFSSFLPPNQCCHCQKNQELRNIHQG